MQKKTPKKNSRRQNTEQSTSKKNTGGGTRFGPMLYLFDIFFCILSFGIPRHEVWWIEERKKKERKEEEGKWSIGPSLHNLISINRRNQLANELVLRMQIN